MKYIVLESSSGNKHISINKINVDTWGTNTSADEHKNSSNITNSFQLDATFDLENSLEVVAEALSGLLPHLDYYTGDMFNPTSVTVMVKSLRSLYDNTNNTHDDYRGRGRRMSAQKWREEIF